MNTDASNVEDINIHQIKECLLLSCVASLRIGPVCFALEHSLCKNDLDFNDMSDSATMSESISSSSTINLSVCCVNKPGGCSLTSLLEKTNSCQHSTLSNLMSKRPKQVFLFFDAAHSMSSEVIDFHIWFSPGFLMQQRLHRETKFIVGFDFAVTLSSPASSCVLFDNTSRKLVELKWLMSKQTQKMIPFITCEISLGQKVCELVFGVSVFDLDFGVQIDSIE